MNQEENQWEIAREVVSSIAPLAMPVFITRPARKGITLTTHLSCCASINLVEGIIRDSSPGTTPSFEKKKTRAQVSDHPAGRQEYV